MLDVPIRTESLEPAAAGRNRGRAIRAWIAETNFESAKNRVNFGPISLTLRRMRPILPIRLKLEEQEMKVRLVGVGLVVATALSAYEQVLEARA